MGVADEIAEMNKVFDSVVTPPKADEPESSQNPTELSNNESEPESVEAKTESDEKAAEAAPEDKPEVKEEPDERDKVISDLRARVADMEAEKAKPKVEPSAEPKVEPLEEQDFIGEVDLDDLGRDPKEFNKVLNKIYQKAVSDAHARIQRDLPKVVESNITLMENMKRTSDQFYEENPDLKSFQKVVASVFEEMASAAPDKSYMEVVKGVAPEVRKRLGITEKPPDKGGTQTKNDPPPKLPSKGARAGSVQTQPNTDPLQAELEEMSKSLGR